jgi:hypothetical protein
VLLGLGRRHDTGDISTQSTLPVGELAVEALHLGVSAAQPASLRLHLPRELVQLCAQLHH